MAREGREGMNNMTFNIHWYGYCCCCCCCC